MVDRREYSFAYKTMPKLVNALVVMYRPVDFSVSASRCQRLWHNRSNRYANGPNAE